MKAREGDALRDVLAERQRQDALWGEQNHDPFVYGAILVEEAGEFMQAALQTRFGGSKGGLDRMREEAVHTAAVALAIVECLDRAKWAFPVDSPDRDAAFLEGRNFERRTLRAQLHLDPVEECWRK